MLHSYSNVVGLKFEALDLQDPDIAKTVFDGEYALLSHGTEVDPLFNYANRTALNLFEVRWGDFLKIPSRESAESGFRKDREKFMKQISNQGYAIGYNGVRISSKGHRFRIKNVTIWNIYNQHGQSTGQAAYFRDWEHL